MEQGQPESVAQPEFIEPWHHMTPWTLADPAKQFHLGYQTAPYTTVLCSNSVVKDITYIGDYSVHLAKRGCTMVLRSTDEQTDTTNCIMSLQGF